MKRALWHLLTVGALMGSATFAPAQTNDQFFRSWRWSADQAPARVAGLAGAFVAVSDDASASVFNPAGLVQLQKTEFLGGILIRGRGVSSSGVRDTLNAVTGIGFAGGAAALSPKWRLGGYVVQPQDRRSSLASVPLPDGTTTAGFLDTQLTEVGGAVAWHVRPRLSLGARVTATHLKLEAHEVRTGSVESEVGAAAGETRVTGSFGGLLMLGRTLRLGMSGQPGAAYRVQRTANRAGRAADTGSESELRQPGALAFGVAYQPSPRVLLIGQLDYVRYSEVRDELVVRSGSSAVPEYQLDDALEPRLAIEGSVPMGSFSLQFRAGVHSQAPGFLAYAGAAPIEVATFRGGRRQVIGGLGASLVTRAGFRLDVGGRLGGEQKALVLTGGFQF